MRWAEKADEARRSFNPHSPAQSCHNVTQEGPGRFGLGLLRFALSCLAGRVRAISVAMTLRHSLALLLGFTLSCCPPVFAHYRQIAAPSSGAAEAAAKLVDEQLPADILTRIQKSGADGGVAFPTLAGKMDWFLRAGQCFT